jgi:folate-binding protein YgfZ
MTHGIASILVGGADARSFLQGQLSADMDALRPQQPLPASCNSPQGRVQAVVWLVERSDGIVLLLPASLIDSILPRLRKYVLRAKVKIEPGHERLRVSILPRSALPAAAASLQGPAHHEIDGRSFVTLPGLDVVLTLGPTEANSDAVAEAQWRLSQIRAGLPQVYPETHEAFVAQMLNLDLLGGISFEKGCYTGQEIIARAHFRGTVKRRMFRFGANSAPPAPGTRILAGEHHAGDVVDSAATEQGCELLAVISLAQLQGPLHLDGTEGATLQQLSLPYAVTS